MDTAALVALTLAATLGTLGLTFAVLRRRTTKAHAELQRAVGGEALLRRSQARSLGLESGGTGQVRGNGWLALTPTRLIFTQWVPLRTIEVPLGDVTSADTGRSWLGKRVGRDLLIVRWSTDAAAWQVPALEAWLEELRRE